jgi:hypothetical protein
MRLFSHEWAASDDEAACRRIADDYAELLRTYPPPARGPVARFVESIDLRGAILDGLAVDEDAGTVAAEIFCGDRPTGYKLLTLVYEDASVETADREVFERVLAAAGPQIRYDEFDLAADRRQRASCRHRYLFWPKEYGEASIEFFNLSWTLQPARERRRSAEDAQLPAASPR